MKITLAPRNYGYTGEELAGLLRREDIECEFSDPDYLVMMVTPETGEEGLRRLERALKSVPRRRPLEEKRPEMPEPCPAIPLHQAMMAPAEEVPAEKSLGRVLADPCVSCPPAVPILLAGEKISRQAIDCFRYYGVERLLCVKED